MNISASSFVGNVATSGGGKRALLDQSPAHPSSIFSLMLGGAVLADRSVLSTELLTLSDNEAPYGSGFASCP